MDTAAYVSAVRSQGDLLGRIAATDLARRVPSCPDWDVAGLIAHTSWVHRYVTAVLRAGPDGKVNPKELATAPKGEAVLAWYGEGLEALLGALAGADRAGADLTATYRTFTGPQPGTWWARRMAHETVMHRWDGQAAVAEPDPIPADLAVDGIDEALDTYARHRFDHERFGSAGQTVHLHATDIDGEWLLTMDPTGLTWERGHRKGDVALRGPAAMLELWVMGRVTSDRLDVIGDVDLAPRWQDASAF